MNGDFEKFINLFAYNSVLVNVDEEDTIKVNNPYSTDWTGHTDTSQGPSTLKPQLQYELAVREMDIRDTTLTIHEWKYTNWDDLCLTVIVECLYVCLALFLFFVRY